MIDSSVRCTTPSRWKRFMLALLLPALLSLAVPAEASVLCSVDRVEVVKQWTHNSQRYVGAEVLLDTGTRKVFILCDLGSATPSVTQDDCEAILNTLTVASAIGSKMTVTLLDGVPAESTTTPPPQATTCDEVDEWSNLEDWLRVVNLHAN